jgi:hypothetical protein
MTLAAEPHARGQCNPNESFGALCIQQTPAISATVPQAWEVTEVAPEGDPYVYDITRSP